MVIRRRYSQSITSVILIVYVFLWYCIAIPQVDDFLKAVDDRAKAYRSSNIILTMGSDFQYQNARTWYKNLDKLIKWVEDREDIRKWTIPSKSVAGLTIWTFSKDTCCPDVIYRNESSWFRRNASPLPNATQVAFGEGIMYCLERRGNANTLHGNTIYSS